MRSNRAGAPRLHPLEAVGAVRRLFATGDTREIFAIFRALRGRSGVRAFSRFCASPTGSAGLRERPRPLDTLTDRARLAALPQRSVGGTYFDFMGEENLSSGGLVEGSQNWDHDPVPPDFAL